jgi:hypothetical protein
MMLLATLCFGRVLSVDIPAPDYRITNGTLVTEDACHVNVPGAPNIPCRTVTICVPPGAVIESVLFFGSYHLIGTVDISPTPPPLPLVDNGLTADLYARYEQRAKQYHMRDALYPAEYGTVLSNGGLRKYTVVDVACYHFAFNPVSRELYYTPTINVNIRYHMPAPDSKRAQFWNSLKRDVTYDGIAKDIIYNWHDAQYWYHTNTPQRANGYYIIIPASLTSAVDTLVAYYQNRGYDVHVVTKEHIETNITGADLQQKIRNYLRENLADIAYLLLVGFSSDVPWRSMVPFNNDPDSPWNHPDYSPIPSDLYYAELTDHDTLGWNSDRDAYYGEVYDQDFNSVGEDNPDYHADIHLGRIPYSSPTIIEHICKKLIRFDTNTDYSYKTASLLAGALYYYANEDYSGMSRNDGAEYLEQLMTDGILDRAHAVYLYEKGGLAPCPYTCTDSLTHTNMVSYWQQKGIMYECHHGNNVGYARKIWAWDDGDGTPETFEMQWPFTLTTSDVNQLDDDYPATAVLRSCLCGNPDVVGLGSQLLNRGASAVISSSRICWMTSADRGGIPYHFFERLLVDTLSTDAVIGDAYDLARTDFMTIGNFWLPVYHYNLFGDPAVRQLGRTTGITELNSEITHPAITIFPNPTRGPVTIHSNEPSLEGTKMIIYDESGSVVEDFHMTTAETSTFDLALPSGVYFLEMRNGSESQIHKLVITK